MAVQSGDPMNVRIYTGENSGARRTAETEHHEAVFDHRTLRSESVYMRRLRERSETTALAISDCF